ncbi:MAG: flagellar biosynthesis anti-sigma factor FlgM [Candidatus Hydrogenedentales bacterium]|jgi:anti-sigma28 factor (negative regulator of flagellin synthesis)
MAGILGITGIPEPANIIQPNGRGVRGTTESATKATDELSISPEAEKAAVAARLLGNSAEDDEVRAELIERARKSIEEGTYRVQQVVMIVAARVSKFLDEKAPETT